MEFLFNVVALFSIRLTIPVYRCILDERYEQTIGMAIECRRLDKLEEAINLREYGCEIILCHSYLV